MKTHDVNTEALVIRSILDNQEYASSLSHLDAGHFYEAPIREILKRITVYLDGGKPIPSSQILRNDESLSESSRALLANQNFAVLRSKDDFTAAVDILKKYRKVRTFVDSINSTIDKLQADDADLDTAMDELEHQIQDCRGITEKNIGMKHYSHADIDQLSQEIESDLRQSDEKDFITTGLGQFDQRTGGLRRKNVLVMASVPGGGKSALSFRMAMNQYLFGHNVCFVSYEMDEIELRYRMLSSESRVDHSEINLKRINDKKIKLITERFRRFISESDKGNRLTIWTPDRELTVQQIALELKPMNYDVVYIDYISLLKPTNPKKQMWEILGDHSRAAKLAANNLNAAVVLLAQYDDESNRLKYSKAIQANANFVWAWEHGEKEKEMGLINIKQLKARNAPMYSFYLQKDFATFTFSDYNGPDPEEDLSNEDKKKPASKTKTQSKAQPEPVKKEQEKKKRKFPGMPELKLPVRK